MFVCLTERSSDMMKRIFAVIAAAAAAFQLTAAAEDYISFYGHAPVGYSGKWLTCMTVKNGSDTASLNPDNVGWIGQERIAEDGSYRISIPASQFSGDFELLSGIPLKNEIFVSELTGSDLADGSAAAPLKTLTAALAAASEGDIIVLTDMVSVPKNVVWCTDKAVTLTGKNPATGKITGGLDLTATISMRVCSSAVFENMTFNTIEAPTINDSANKIFACGNRLVMGEGLSMTNPIDIFGGNTINNSANGTDLTINSGTYRRIYGGGENSPTYGDTHITITGMNSGYSANDSSTAYYDSRIFGGGKNSGSGIEGSTYINFSGGTAAYIVGASSASSVSGDTHICISGGRVMNVYGGTGDKTTVHSGNSYIEMTGGTAESLYGGSMSIGFSGNTSVRVTGGEILRRIYGGCYNDFDGSWKSDYSVSGTTAVIIGPEAELVTGGDLSWDNKANSGIFGGSRTASNPEGETGILIFEQDAYSVHGDKIGEKGSFYVSYLLSHHDYLIRAGAGGTVSSAGGTDIRISAQPGKAAVVNGVKLLGGAFTLSGAETEIVFENGYTIIGADSEKSGSAASVNTEVAVGSPSELTGAQIIIAAVYDSENRFAALKTAELDESGSNNLSINLPELDGSFRVRLFVWDSKGLRPLGMGCSFILGEGFSVGNSLN